MCHSSLIEKKIIKPYASFRCIGLFYNNTFILATPSNGRVECRGGDDELQEISINIMFHMISGILSIFIMLLIIVPILKIIFSKVKRTQEYEPQKDQSTNSEAMNKYRLNPENKDTIDNISIHLMKTILTKSITEKKETCISFYDLEMEIHDGLESELYRSLKRKFDPVITKNILEAKFPRCIDSPVHGTWSCSYIVCRPFTLLKIEIERENKILKKIIKLILTILKIEARYIVQLKDFILSFLMLQAIGGLYTIVEFPGYFTSVMVVIMLSSIIVPAILSSIHLAVNNPFMIVRSDGKESSKMPRCMAKVLSFLLSAANPIFLQLYYDEKKEEARRLIQNSNIEAIRVLQQCRKIKKQAMEFLKIALGY